MLKTILTKFKLLCYNFFEKEGIFMNVTLPEEEKISKKRVIIYAVAIAICVIALIVAVCVQILGNDITNKIFGVSQIKSKTEEEEQTLKTNFDNLFLNSLEITGDINADIKKQDESKDYVVTTYEKKETVSGKYEMSVFIPYINIDNDTINQYNNEIKEIFQDKAESILETEGQNVLYTVDYQGYIENNILTVIIKSSLKQGASAQQLIVQTYNYDLVNNKEITLNDEIDMLALNKTAVQNKIRSEIKAEQDKAEALQELGYEIYNRDSESDYYSIDNSNIFFVHDQNLYIIYPYGNDALTSEMDIVIV